MAASMENGGVATRLCETPACDKEAKLQCPTSPWKMVVLQQDYVKPQLVIKRQSYNALHALN